MAKERTVSGMRPTGPLHIGHYFGALKNRVAMQEEMEKSGSLQGTIHRYLIIAQK